MVFFFKITPKDGGKDSKNAALLLSNIYLKWFLKKNIIFEIIEESKENNLLRKIVVKIDTEGEILIFLLKEVGLHKIIRNSFFNKKFKRQTSLVLIEVFLRFSIEKIQIKKNDLKIETCRSSGHGGQHINTTDSAVVMTYLPLKIVVRYSGERSQLKNRERALELLKLKILENRRTKRLKELNKERLIQKQIIRGYFFTPKKLIINYKTNKKILSTLKFNQIVEKGNLDLLFSHD